MKNKGISLLLAVFAVATLFLPATFAAQGDPWFDLDNCKMCQPMTQEKGLMENMEWENHLTADGMMTVTVIAPGYEKAFESVMKKMEATGEKLMAGEKMHLCGFCQSYGGLQMAGATFENFVTGGGLINLVTSRDPAVIEMIHEHGQKTIDEHAKMMAAMDGGDHGHKDHPDHPSN